WVALFHLAGAVVVDTGGQMSHGAIVARELGLPCVTGTTNGTRRLSTGDLVRVDGTAGRVEVLIAAGRAVAS
ncbi:MAG TPA: PEP-utilizing enzyme, partial [Acidimicrobiia bacterium]|nr:PEP-utilizing enzyme [Acidimicrobiia bacterium]